MPSGRTHDRITLYTLPITAGLSWLVSRDGTATLLVCGGFLFSGLMLGPDLDVRSVHYRRWGWLRWIWIPYRGSVKHRSVVSHSPFVGTVVRVVYLLAWLIMLALIGLTIANEIAQLGWTWNEMAEWVGRSLQTYRNQWVALFIGLELGALSHYMADWGVTTAKRIRKQGWKSTLQTPFGSSSKRRRSSKSKTGNARSPSRRTRKSRH